MFIEKIRLENWLSHVDTTLTFEKVTSFRGENGAGKTSVQSALEMLLTGRSVHTDDKGSGSRDLIRRGTEKGVVTVSAKFGERQVHLRCSVTEKSGRTIAVKDPTDETWTGGDFLSNLAAKREILDCLINGRYFLDMDDARQKKLLAGILLPQSVTLEEWVSPALKECGVQIDLSLRAFELITAAHEKVYNERKLINRLVKEWKEPDAPPAAAVDLKVIRERLAERQEQRTQLAVKRDAVLRDFEKEKAKSAKLQEKLGQLQGRLTTELQRKKDVAKDLLSKSALKDRQAIAANGEKAKSIEASIQTVTASLGVERKEQKRLGQLEDETCPTCTQPLSDSHMIAMMDKIAQNIDALTSHERTLQEQRKAYGDWEGAERDIEAHAKAEKDGELVQKHVDEIEQDIQDAKNEREKLAGIEDRKPDTAETDASIAEMDVRIVKGNAALADAIRGEERKATYDAAMATKKKLDAKQSLLEKLVDYFGPKGIQAKLLDEHVGGFQESMNKVLAGWGFRCELQFEPFSFRAGLHGSTESFSLRTMSAGQRAMFTAAFQVALAKVTDFNFVCIDDAEVFSTENRVTLFKNLVSAGLDQALIMAADVRREIPRDENKQPRPGTAFYLFSLDRTGAVPTTIVERLT